jgi:uncharacterized protein (DUF58 family)
MCLIRSVSTNTYLRRLLILAFVRLKQLFSLRAQTWLSKRIPSAKQHNLSNKNIFIMPTRFGFSFMFFVMVLFLLATNYQNNIIMLFSYLMASLFITAMMNTFFNLSGLTVKAQNMSYGYAEQPLSFAVSLHSKQSRYALNLAFKDQSMTTLEHCHQGDNLVNVLFTINQRGRFPTGRLKISSEYCFGLFVAWTHLDFASYAVVYPKSRAIEGALPNLSAPKNNDDENSNLMPEFVQGTDDFYQLKPYELGEPLSRVAWKQLAKGQGRFSKQYQQNQGKLCWLTLAAMPSHNLETKLQYLCFLIAEHSKTGQPFGLDLSLGTSTNTRTAAEVKINPDVGTEHLKSCLIALADFPKNKAKNKTFSKEGK